MARDLEDRLDAAVRRGDAQDRKRALDDATLAALRTRPRAARARAIVALTAACGPTPVVALDLGSKKTGWALRRPDRALEHGVREFKLARGETEGMLYRRFRVWLHGLLVKCDAPGPKPVLAFEAPHQRGGAATALALGLRSHVLELAEQHGLEVAIVHTATLKKHATGCGKAGAGKIKDQAERRAAGKAAMKRAAAKRWRLAREPESDDEADALCVLSWVLEQIGETT